MKLSRPALLALLSLCSAAHAGELHVVDRPIPFGAVRQELTLQYIRQHYDPGATGIEITPRAVVIHWTGSPTLSSALATFAPEALPKGRPELVKGGRLNVSAHFVVDRDGTVYRLLPENRMARHAIGLNRSALGIENVGGPKWPLTDLQLRADAELVRALAGKYPTLRHLLGHFEYLKLRAPAQSAHPWAARGHPLLGRGTDLWEERDPSYLTRKEDPGPEFMARLREEVKELGLQAP